MYAFLQWNPQARPQWEEALRLVRAGVPSRDVIVRTGVKRSTFYRRLCRERALLGCRPLPM